jgi:hypothetical protein
VSELYQIKLKKLEADKQRLEELTTEYQAAMKQLGEAEEIQHPRLKRIESAKYEVMVELAKQVDELERELLELQKHEQQDELQRRFQLKKQAVQVALDALINILGTDESQLQLIIQAYKKTAAYWPVKINSDAKTVDSIIYELEKITQGKSPYTAQEEFIAHLFSIISDVSLISGLNQWTDQYRNGREWLQLHTEIQSAQQKWLEIAQFAILIKITRSDEASTQNQFGETLYQMNAWLIEDIKTYENQQRGIHSLIATGSSEAAPCILETLLQKIPDLVQHFIKQQKSLCPNRTIYPEIHVFLPLELMHLAVDFWQCNPRSTKRPAYLGHDHVVVLHCANRYDATYNKDVYWRRIWDNQYQLLLKTSAKDVFISGHDDDLESLIDQLDDVVEGDDKQIVGLHLTQAPIDTEAMCYELLDSGLPLAIWPRENLLNNAHAVDLPALLAACCLENLPHDVQQKRHETRRSKNTPDNHIGHHLSLLWDNPHLVPPKSA